MKLSYQLVQFKTKQEPFEFLISLKKDCLTSLCEKKIQNEKFNGPVCQISSNKTIFTELQFRGGGCGASKQESNQNKEQIEKGQLPKDFIENFKTHSNIIIDQAKEAHNGSYQQNEIIMSIQWFHYNNEYINLICQDKILLSQLLEKFSEKFENFLKILPNYLLVSSFLCYRILQISNEILRVIFASQLANKNRSMKIQSHQLYLQYIEEFKNQLEIESAHIWKTEIEYEITLIEIMLKNCSTDSEEGKQILTQFMLNALQSVFQMSPTEDLTASMIDGVKYLLKIAYEKVKYPIEVYEIYYYFQSLKWQIIKAIKSGLSVQSQIKQLIEGYKNHIVKSDNWIIHYSWIQIIFDILSYRVVIKKSLLFANQQFQNQQESWNYLLQKKIIKQLSYNRNEAIIQLFSDSQTINQDLFQSLFKKYRINQYSLFCQALIQEKFYDDFDLWTFYSNFKFKSSSTQQKSTDSQILFSNTCLQQIKILLDIFESCNNSIQNQSLMLNDLISDLSKRDRQSLQFKLEYEEIVGILQIIRSEIAKLILITNEIHEKCSQEGFLLNLIFENLNNSEFKNNKEFKPLYQLHLNLIQINKNKIFHDLIEMIRQAQVKNIQAQIISLILKIGNQKIVQNLDSTAQNSTVQEFIKEITKFILKIQKTKESLRVIIAGKNIEFQFSFSEDDLRKIYSENFITTYLKDKDKHTQQSSLNLPQYFFQIQQIHQFIYEEQLNKELQKIQELKQFKFDQLFNEVKKTTKTTPVEQQNDSQQDQQKSIIIELLQILKDIINKKSELNDTEWKYQKMNEILFTMKQSLELLQSVQNDSINQSDQKLIYDFHLQTVSFLSSSLEKSEILKKFNEFFKDNLEQEKYQKDYGKNVSDSNQTQTEQMIQTEEKKSDDLIESFKKNDEYLKNQIRIAQQLLDCIIIQAEISARFKQEKNQQVDDQFQKTWEDFQQKFNDQKNKQECKVQSQNSQLIQIKEENLLIFFHQINEMQDYEQFNLDPNYLNILENLNIEKPVERSIFQFSKDYKVRECLVVNLIKLQASSSEEYIIKFVQQQIKNIWIIENDDEIRNLLKNKDLLDMQKQLFSHDLKSFTASIKSEMQQRLDNMQALEQELRLEGNQQLKEKLKEKLSLAYQELDQYLENIQDFGSQMNISLIFLKEISKDLKQLKNKIDALQNSLNVIQDDLRKLRGKKFDELLIIRKQKVLQQKQLTDSDSVYIAQKTIEYDPIAGTKIYDMNYQEISFLLDEKEIRNFKGEINEFLWDDSKIKDVLLLKGQAGSGKSKAAQKIEEFLWQVHGKDSEWIPIYVSLPSIKNPKFNLFEQAMESEYYNFDQTQTKEFKAAIYDRQIKVLLIFDSYDEMKQDCIQCNLINTNKLINDLNVDNLAKQVKFIITTRIEILNTLQYKTWFFGSELQYLKEVELRSFDADQVQEYLFNYVTLNAKRKIRNLYEYIKQLQEKDFDLNEFEAIWKIAKQNVQKQNQNLEGQEKLFDDNQIDEIVEQLISHPFFKYIKEEQIINLKKDFQSLWNQNKFQNSIKNLNIEHLLKTPFMLEIIVQVLPLILNNYSGSMSFREQFQNNLIKILSQQNKSKRKIAKYQNLGKQNQKQLSNQKNKQTKKEQNEILIANQIRQLLENEKFFQEYSPSEEMSTKVNKILVSDNEYSLSQYTNMIVQALKMKKYTGFQFYESFINFFHDQQTQKLRQLGKISNCESFLIDVYQFSQSFALDLTMKQLTQVSYQQKGKLKLDTKFTSFQQMNNWLDQYFNDQEDIKDYKKLIRSCVLLNAKGTSFSFIHKSIQEFLVAKYIYDTVGSFNYSSTQQQGGKVLNQLSESLYNDLSFNISSDNYLGILQLVRQEMDSIENIDEKLINVVTLSRSEKFKRAASNCIYLLSVRNAYLGERDFNHIQLQDTNLCSLSFYASNLSFSKFQNVKIDSCNFDYCNLNDAIWKNIDTNEKPYIENPTGEIQCLTVSADDILVAVGDSSGLITIWIISNFQQKYYSKKHSKSVNCLKFTKNCKKLASCDDGFVYIWDLSNQENVLNKEIFPIASLEKHDYNFKQLLLTKDELKLYTVNNNGLVIIWNFDNIGKDSDFYLQDKNSNYLDFVITKNGQEIYVIDENNKKIVNYQINSQKVLQQIPFFDLRLQKLYLSNDDQYLVSIDLNSKLIIWDVSVKNQAILVYFENHIQEIQNLQFSKNNKILQTFGNGVVLCREIEKMKESGIQEYLQFKNCQQITMSQNQDFYLIVKKYAIYFIDSITNQIINSIQTNQNLIQVHISTQTDQFAFVNNYGMINILDTYKFLPQYQITTRLNRNNIFLSLDWKDLIEYDRTYLIVYDINKMSEFQKNQYTYSKQYIKKFSNKPNSMIVVVYQSNSIIVKDFESYEIDDINYEIEYNNPVLCIQFSQDGEDLLLGQQNGQILQLNKQSKQFQKLLQFNFPIHSLAFSKDSHYLAVSSIDETQIINFKSKNEIIFTIKFEEQDLSEQKVFSSNLEFLVTGYQNNILIYNFRLNKKFQIPLNQAKIMLFDLSSDENHLVILDSEATLFFLDLQSLKIIKSFRSEYLQYLIYIKLINNIKTLLTVDYDIIRLWDVNVNDENLIIQKCCQVVHHIQQVSITTDLQNLFIYSENQLQYFNIEKFYQINAKKIFDIIKINKDNYFVPIIEFSQDKKTLGLGIDNTIWLIIPNSLSLIRKVENETNIKSMAISENNQILAYYGEDQFLRIKIISTNFIIWQIQILKNIEFMNFTDDNQNIISICDNLLMIVSLNNLQQIQFIDAFKHYYYDYFFMSVKNRQIVFNLEKDFFIMKNFSVQFYDKILPTQNFEKITFLEKLGQYALVHYNKCHIFDENLIKPIRTIDNLTEFQFSENQELIAVENMNVKNISLLNLLNEKELSVPKLNSKKNTLYNLIKHSEILVSASNQELVLYEIRDVESINLICRIYCANLKYFKCSPNQKFFALNESGKIQFIDLEDRIAENFIVSESVSKFYSMTLTQDEKYLISCFQKSFSYFDPQYNLLEIFYVSQYSISSSIRLPDNMKIKQVLLDNQNILILNESSLFETSIENFLSEHPALKSTIEFLNPQLCMSFSQNNRLIAFGGEDNKISIYEMESKRQVAVYQGHSLPISALDFSSNGKMIISGSQDKLIRFWNINNNQTAIFQDGHASMITKIIFSPDGCLIVSASEDGQIGIWDVDSKKFLCFLKNHTKKVNYIEFSKDQNYLVSCCDEGKVIIWNIEYISEIKIYNQMADINFSFKQIKILDNCEGILCLYNQDGQSQNQYISYWKFSKDSSYIEEVWSSDNETIMNFKIIPVTNQIIFLNEENKLLCFTSNDSVGECLGNENIIDFCVALDGKYLISLDREINLHILAKKDEWELSTFNMSQYLCVKEEKNFMEFSNRNDQIFFLQEDYISFFDIQSKQNYIEDQQINIEDAEILILQVNQNRNLLAVASQYKINEEVKYKIDLINLIDFQSIKSYHGCTERINFISFSFDNQFIAIADKNDKIMIFDYKLENLISTYQPQYYRNKTSFIILVQFANDLQNHILIIEHNGSSLIIIQKWNIFEVQPKIINFYNCQQNQFKVSKNSQFIVFNQNYFELFELNFKKDSDDFQTSPIVLKNNSVKDFSFNANGQTLIVILADNSIQEVLIETGEVLFEFSKTPSIYMPKTIQLSIQIFNYTLFMINQDNIILSLKLDKERQRLIIENHYYINQFSENKIFEIDENLLIIYTDNNIRKIRKSNFNIIQRLYFQKTSTKTIVQNDIFFSLSEDLVQQYNFKGEKLHEIRIQCNNFFLSNTFFVKIHYDQIFFFLIEDLIIDTNQFVDFVPKFQFSHNQNNVNNIQIQISQDEQFMASQSEKQIIKLWNIQDQKNTYLQAIFFSQNTQTQILRFSLDSQSFYLKTDNKINKYNLKNYFQKKVYECLDRKILSFEQLIINNKKLKTIFSSNHWLNDFNNLSKNIFDFSYFDQYLNVVLSKDLNYLAYITIQSPNCISVYKEIDDDQEENSDYIYCGSLDEHKGQVLSLAISAESKFLLSGSNDSSLILWDLKSCSFITKINLINNLVNCLAFSPSSFYIAVGLQTGNVELYFQKFIDDQKIIDKNLYLIKSLQSQEGLGCIKVFSKQPLLQAKSCLLERFEINIDGSYMDILFKQKQRKKHQDGN